LCCLNHVALLCFSHSFAHRDRVIDDVDSTTAAEVRLFRLCFVKEKPMSFVTAQPDALAAAANHLQGIGSAMATHNAAAAGPTAGVVPAAADEVSALTAAQFARHAQMYQGVSAQAAAIHDMFVTILRTSAESYAATEAANAAAAV
jgi:PE family